MAPRDHDRDPRPVPRELQEALDALQSQRFGSLEAAQRFLDRRMLAYNARPQRELGGLSPMQMHELLSGDWLESGALRLERSLALADLNAADFFHDARTVLTMLRDEGPAKVTAAGNLSRTFVAAMRERLRLLQRDDDYAPPLPSKVVNEGDLIHLLVLRHVLGFAGLIIKRKGFRITRLGRELLGDDRAGELYALLFHTFFRTLDLRVLDNSDRHPGLQATIAFSFHMLASHAREWATPEHLAEDAWLEDTKDPPTPSDVRYGDLRHWSFRHRVLEPLFWFGLLERRDLPRTRPWERPVEFRRTPLFERFVRVQFSAPGLTLVR